MFYTLYQFVFSKGITIPFKIHGQYPHHHISLETSSSDEITEHHEHTLLVVADDDSEVEGDYTMLNQLGSNKVQVYVYSCIASKHCCVTMQDSFTDNSEESSCANISATISVYGR